MKLNNCELIKEQNGYNFALGISGTPEDIQGVYLWLYNSGVTCADGLQDMGSANFAYTWVNPERFIEKMALWSLGNDSYQDKLTQYKGKQGGMIADYRAYWSEFWEGIERESFLPETEVRVIPAHGLGVSEGLTVWG